MDDSFEAKKQKMKELQYDVIDMRKNVPSLITELYEKHLEMLEARFQEIDEQEVSFVEPKYKPITRDLEEYKSMRKDFDHKAAIVQLNSRLDGLQKAKEFVKKYNQSWPKNEDVRF